MPFTIRSQRDAIATLLGWDRSEVSEYQYTRRHHAKTFLYNVGDGYGVAVKEGQPVPAVYDEYNLKKAGTTGGWDVYFSPEAVA
jgi:hypothetical protein